MGVMKPCEEKPLTREGLHSVAYELIEIILRKNQAYGDSWRKYGEVASIFPNIARKFDRLANILLERYKSEDYDENIVDTVADLTAYSLLYLWWLSEHRPDLYNEWTEKMRKEVLGDGN